MTAKVFMSNLGRKWKTVLQGILKTPNTGVKVGKTLKQTDLVQPVVRAQSSLSQSRLFNVWKKIVPTVYYRSLARELGHQAAWRRAKNLPLLAFVGLVVSQHADEEDDELADRIQNFVKRTEGDTSSLLQRVQELSLDKFEFGQLIGQGCNAAVYEACLIPEDSEVGEINCIVSEDDPEKVPDAQIVSHDNIDDAQELDEALVEDKDLLGNDSTEFEQSDEDMSQARRVPILIKTDDDSDSDITILNLSDFDEEESIERPAHIFYVDDDRAYDFDDESDTDSDISIVSLSDVEEEVDDPGGTLLDFHEQSKNVFQSDVEVKDIEENINQVLSEEENSSVEVSVDDGQMYNSLNSNFPEVDGKYNLAVKMMFNYGVESNADAILREMDRETVPARLAQSREQMLLWQNGHKVRKKQLPPHPNIVEMWGVFVDPVPHLPDSLLNYPAALPARINPNGIGRNMTMFLVMKKYQYTLREYLLTFCPSFHERLILFGQLLEAVAHMRRHSVAHRDLKLDNIFLDTTTDMVPQLVVGDFGCCLADDKYGMQIPYPTDHMDRGGNTALMAPEISSAEPGLFKYLDYRKADLWATGTLAYEIFGGDNPFYTNKRGWRLDSRTYSVSELPPLPDHVPQPVKTLISSMLERDPNKRPTARFAADLIQVLLWAPSDWLLPGNTISNTEAKWWIVSMATEVLLGTRSTERNMKCSFVQNFNMLNLEFVFAFLGIKV